MASRERSYSDDDLRRAIAGARSWRGVMRELGLHEGSGSTSRAVRRRAESLGLDTSHFTGQRRWTDRQLADAVAASLSWNEVAERLGLASSSSTSLIKGHALRLGLEHSHFTAGPPSSAIHPWNAVWDVDRLPRAGSMLAAAWFTLCGYDVSWPLEPSPYDLVVAREDRFLRVQVKTTRCRRDGTHQVKVATSGRGSTPYDPGDLDYFFVISDDFAYHLIPVAAVGGRRNLHLRNYERYCVATAQPRPSPATPAATTCPPPRTDGPGSA